MRNTQETDFTNSVHPVNTPTDLRFMGGKSSACFQKNPLAAAVSFCGGFKAEPVTNLELNRNR